MKPTPDKVFIVMGVSGCGKTSLGERIAKKLRIPFFDGDDFHPETNIAKMKRGEALNDENRYPWLQKLNALGREWVRPGCVIACSALKSSYRELLSSGIASQVVWVYLEGDYETILGRLQNRKGHFMPVDLLTSQFQTLEPPRDAIRIAVDLRPEEQLKLLLRSWKAQKKSGP